MKGASWSLGKIQLEGLNFTDPEDSSWTWL